jgi:amino acid transporter
MSNENAIRRDIGGIALLFTGLGSIIGSGWLFGAWKVAKLAGPDGVWAWVIGAVVITFVALTYAEQGAMFPESGGSVRYGFYSHGSFVGFVTGWAAWIAIVSVIPAEAEASVQYMSSWHWDWAHALYGNGELSNLGLSFAAVLVIVYFLLNYWSVKIFAHTNSAITFFKLIVPAATAITLICTQFNKGNFHIGIHGGPHVGNLAPVLTAVATGSIVFSYNGFQMPVNLAGEARNPGRNVPLAIFGSIALSTVIYVLLQLAYLGAVSPEQAGHGWATLDFSSPFAQLAVALNLNWLALLLYSDAFVSPSGTGSTYTASTARMIYAMERNGTIPKIFGRVHPKYGIPQPAMWLNLVVSFIFLFNFRGWGGLAEVISVATIITYLVVPISVMALRRTAPGLHRPLRIPGLPILAPIAFVLSTLLLYWARWPKTGYIMLLLIVPLPVYLYYQAKASFHDFSKQLKATWWLFVYLISITVLSLIGSKDFGGRDIIPYGWDQLVVGMDGLLFYFWGVKSGWRTPAIEALEAGIPAP